MQFKSFIILTFVALVVWMAGCSSGGADAPMLPLDGSANVTHARNYGTDVCLGTWNVVVDIARNEIDALKLRDSDLALNVLSFLEPPALEGLNINFSTLVVDPENKLVSVDVMLTHPINDPVFMGFDVRGIVFGPRLLNPDGFTEFMNPDDFKGVPFGYKDGLLGTPDSYANYSDKFYAYKYFCDGLGVDDNLAVFMSDMSNLQKRGVFTNGSVNTRHYDLSWQETNAPISFLVYNYAVYANYNWPNGDAPMDINDFEITTANSAEPFCASIVEIANGLYYSGGSSGGSIFLEAEIWDWQGAQSLEVTVESPGVITETPATSSGPGSLPTDMVCEYDFIDIPGHPKANGSLDIFIIATDPSVTFGDAWFMGLLSPMHDLYYTPVYTVFRHTTEVLACPKPYIITINPNKAVPGSVYNDAVITGDFFVSGADLAVKVVAPGEPDIVATDVKVINTTKITCDLNFTGAAFGKRDVEITNGCGTTATLADGFEVVTPANPAGNVILEVQRIDPAGPNYMAIDSNDNIYLHWDPVPGAEEYAIYSDHEPYDGFSFTAFEGLSPTSEFYDTLSSDEAAVYIVRARSVAGEPLSESPDSETAFVDFEQAESLTSAGTWSDNNVFDSILLQTTRSSISADVNSGSYGWYDSMGVGSQYCNVYEIFYSENIPVINSASVYRLEVVWDLDDFNTNASYEDGFTIGYFINQPVPGYVTPNNLNLRVAPILSGPSYTTGLDAITDEFPQNGASGAGYTGSTSTWQYSVADVSAAFTTGYPRVVCVAHATDTWYAGSGPTRYYRVDDIAIVVY